MPTFTRRLRAGTLQITSTHLSKNGPMVLLPRILLFLLRPRDAAGSERCAGSVFWFLRTTLGFVAETARVSLRTLAFFFPLVTDTFSSFNVNDSLSTLYHGSRFIQLLVIRP